jgi:hypothetical protein
MFIIINTISNTNKAHPLTIRILVILDKFLLSDSSVTLTEALVCATSFFTVVDVSIILFNNKEFDSIPVNVDEALSAITDDADLDAAFKRSSAKDATIIITFNIFFTEKIKYLKPKFIRTNLMDYEINKTKYLALVGNVQSGKTNEELKYCFQSTIVHKIPVIFIVRNISADQLQLVHRINDFNNKNSSNLNCKILSHINTNVMDFLNNCGIIILLCNCPQLKKIKNVLSDYHGKYNLCIDEADFSLKTKNFASKIDFYLSNLKERANHILGATATPIAMFSGDKFISKVKKLTPNENYCGLESLYVRYINSNISRDPKSDNLAINEIYSTLLQRSNTILLHTVSKYKTFHASLLNYLSNLFPQFTLLTYNGNGIKVICKDRKSNVLLAKPKAVNNYGQLINKYFYVDGVHYFVNYSISEVLQILKDDPWHNHSHISIIAGHLASRGISFVSSDYSLHLTDQYFVPGEKTHGENYLQSLRILGCYKDPCTLTLWCKRDTWRRIIEHNNIIDNLVKCSDNNSKWFEELQKVRVPRPDTPLTRPRLTHGTNFNKIPLSDHFNFEISYQELIESDSESEII